MVLRLETGKNFSITDLHKIISKGREITLDSLYINIQQLFRLRLASLLQSRSAAPLVSILILLLPKGIIFNPEEGLFILDIKSNIKIYSLSLLDYYFISTSFIIQSENNITTAN